MNRRLYDNRHQRQNREGSHAGQHASRQTAMLPPLYDNQHRRERDAGLIAEKRRNVKSNRQCIEEASPVG